MSDSINPEPTAEDEDVDVVAHGVEVEDDGLVEDICIINNSAAL
ncbi:hypothetical protein ACFP3U_00275 [Kitasatospora misakiensis]|uniref:Uncharacterized protein n=1 Tax=Kitasatospora misakiensis TaxID=67330 RepID=A0ABW0WWW9_9ACTN